MKKAQISRNGKIMTFRYKASSSELVDQSEYDYVKNENTGGFLVPQYRKGLFGTVFSADLENSAVLSEKLAAGISSDEFLDLFLQILQCMRKADQLYIKRDRILCDKDYIFVRNSTGSVSMVYLPFKIDYESGSLLSFLTKIIDATNLNDGANVKLRILRDYLTSLNEIELDTVIGRVRQIKGNTVRGDETVEMEDPDHFDDERIDIFEPEEPRISGRVSSDDEPDDDKEGTMLLPKTKNVRIKKRIVGTFSAVNGKDYFEADTKSLTVGRSHKANHRILGNDAVSGIHAEIIKEETDFYIQDSYSSNGTLVNDRQIDPEEMVKLSDGDRVTFADEDYIFHIKQVS